MIKNLKIHRSVKYLAAVLMVSGIGIIQSCIDAIPAESVVEPTSAQAGEYITLQFTVKIKMSAPGMDPSNLIIGFLAPKSWNASKGNNTTVTYTSDLGNGGFVLMGNETKIPNSSFPGLTYGEYLKAVYKAGNNFLDDHEWVVYKSDKVYTLTSNQEVNPVITIRTKVGPQALTTKFGYFATYTGAGATQGGDDSKVYLSNDNCFSVTGGTGDLIDFCTKPLASALPLAASDKDFLTFDFDNDLLPTDLAGVNEVYLCAEATTSDGQVITKCEGVPAMQLKPLPNDEYRLVIYPRSFFGLQKSQTIKQISYKIANKSGSIKVGKRGTDEAFVYKFTPCN